MHGSYLHAAFIFYHWIFKISLNFFSNSFAFIRPWLRLIPCPIRNFKEDFFLPVTRFRIKVSSVCCAMTSLQRSINSWGSTWLIACNSNFSISFEKSGIDKSWQLLCLKFSNMWNSNILPLVADITSSCNNFKNWAKTGGGKISFALANGICSLFKSPKNSWIIQFVGNFALLRSPASLEHSRKVSN